MKVGKGSQHLEVQAFLILERVTDSKHFLISVLLQSGGRFIGKTSRGTVTEGQEIWLSLRWDQPQQRFVASSQAAGSKPVLSFIPFASPEAVGELVHQEFRLAKSFVVNSRANNNLEVHENKN